MIDSIGDILAAAKAGTLRLQAVIVTDWRDGPIEGVARLSVGGGLWKFKILAESPRTDDLNDRLFLLAQLSQDAEETRIFQEVASSGVPLVWPFNDRPDSADLRSAVNVTMESSVAETLVIRSAGFEVAMNAWSIEPGREDATDSLRKPTPRS